MTVVAWPPERLATNGLVLISVPQEFPGEQHPVQVPWAGIIRLEWLGR